MPVAQGSRTPARQALVVGAAAVLGVVAVVFLVSRADQLAGDGEAEVDLADATFTIGQAEEVAEVIRSGQPILLPDAARGDREVWINHQGDDANVGWVAFAARADGAPRDCVVQWDPDADSFVDTCDDTVYPDDGDGLEQYEVSVSPEGSLVIDLDSTS